MERITFDLRTGVKKVIPYTQAEKDEHATKIAIIAAMPAPVPSSVPKWAAVSALIEAGMDTLPDSYFATMQAGKQRKLAQAKWQHKPTLDIGSPILLSAVASGIITQSQVNALMIRADEISKIPG